MKIIFYTTDTILETVLSTFKGDEAVLCKNRNDLDKLINEFQPCTVIFDFDSSELNCREVSRDYITRGNAHTILLTGSLELNDIVKIQQSDFSFDGYLTKPITKEIVLDIVSDIELSLIDNSEEDKVSSSSAVAELDESLIFNIKDLAQSNDESEDKDIEQLLEEEKSLVEEIDDEEDAVDFSSAEIKISSEVRDVINDHNHTEANFDDETNQDIQRKFDCVFGKKVEEPKLGADFSITPEVDVEPDNISFELDEVSNEKLNEKNSGEVPEVVEVKSSNEVSMSDDKDEIGGLEFNIPDEDESSEVNEEGLDFSLDEEADVDKDDEGLSFDVSDDAGLDLSAGEETATESAEVEDEGGLEFNMDEEDSLDLSAETSEIESDSTSEDPADDDEGLDFSMDDSAGLSLGGDEEVSATAEVEVDSEEGLDFGDSSGEISLSVGDSDPEESVAEDTSDDGLVFTDDAEAGLSLSAEDDVIDNTSADDSEEGLDFSTTENKDEDEDEGVDHASIESTDSFQLGESDDIEATISSIVAAPEDSTGDFDMSEVEEAIAPVEDKMEEFDYKTSSGFSADIEAIKAVQLDEPTENTNPTIIANTGSLLEGDLLSDVEEEANTVTKENIGSELSFSETIEDSELFGELHNSDNNLTQTVKTQPLGITAEHNQDNSVSPKMSAKEEYESFRNYDEDEMLRLQGTIRQLREEREGLMGQINQLKSEKQLLEQDNLGLKAELDDVQIELGIVKKRHHDEISDKEYHYKMNQDKKDLYENKSKVLQKDFDRLNQKVRIDFNQVKQREKELESKLELTVMDSESQVKTRDGKILDLKRKIDSLEFNMENSSIREQKHREDKSKLEERLAKIMKTLRGSIQLIEDDLDELDTKNTRDLD